MLLLMSQKRFLNLLDMLFKKSAKLQKTFDGNTVKESYSCTDKMTSINVSHNKKIIKESTDNKVPYNCRVKEECPFDGKCQKTDIIYECFGPTINNPNKVYLGKAKGNFKIMYCNHKASFKSRQGEKASHFLNIFWGCRTNTTEIDY